jgi:hypothetical protein
LRLRVKVLLSLYSEIRRTITAETSLLRCDPVRSTRYTRVTTTEREFPLISFIHLRLLRETPFWNTL